MIILFLFVFISPYFPLIHIAASLAAHVPSGHTLIKTGRPVSMLTIAPNESGQGFAVIFSLSHCVADGHTYFTILNMLGEGSELFAMEEVRNESLRTGLPQEVGEREYKQMTAPNTATILNFLGSMMTAKKTSPQCYYLDKEKVNALKEEVKAVKSESKVPYITTNDIITSGFGKAVKAKLLTMGMDFRGRLEGLTKKHAGNYHLGCLWGPDGYDSPTALRAALNGPPPYSRVDSLPGCCGCWGNWSAMISNWSSLSRGAVNIPVSFLSVSLYFGL